MRSPERVVAAALVCSIVAALALFGVYAAGGQAQAEGASLAVALGGIGIALLVWAKKLMAGIRDETQSRHHGPQTRDGEDASETMIAGARQMQRRTFLSRLLLVAAGALGLAAVIPIRSLGKAPGSSLLHTQWRAGDRLVDVNGDPVTVNTLEVDAFTTVFPEHAPGSADSQAVLVRVDPGLLRLPADQGGGAPAGLVCYSKVCTHAGCPVGLFLAEVHQLRCPCHQSTFDVLDGATPVYGPAPRPLPQLPIEIGDEGFLLATGDFDEPVGPSFWDLPPS